MVKAAEGTVTALAFSENSALLASGHEHGFMERTRESIMVWEVDRIQSVAAASPIEPLGGIGFSADGTVFASAPWGSHPDRRKLEIWDAATGAVIKTVEGSSTFALSPNGQLYAAGQVIHDEYGEFTGFISVRLRATDDEVAHFYRHLHHFAEITFTRDSHNLIADGMLLPLKAEEGVPAPPPDGASTILPPTGSMTARRPNLLDTDKFTEGDKVIDLYDRVSGTLLHHLVARTSGHVRPLLLSPDGSRLLCEVRVSDQHVSWYATYRYLLFELASNSLCWDHPVDPPAGPPAFSPDGSALAISDINHVVQILDVATGNVLARFPCRARPSFVWLPNALTRLRLADGADGKSIVDIELHR